MASIPDPRRPELRAEELGVFTVDALMRLQNEDRERERAHERHRRESVLLGRMAAGLLAFIIVLSCLGMPEIALQIIGLISAFAAGVGAQDAVDRASSPACFVIFPV